MKTKHEARVHRLPGARVTLMLAGGVLGLAICFPVAAQAQAKQVVEIDVAIRNLYFTGPAQEAVTGFISLSAASSGLQHQERLVPPNSSVDVGDLGPASARFEVNRAYPFVCRGAWIYGASYVDFSIPCGSFGYTLTIRDTSGQLPDRVLDQQDSTWNIPAGQSTSFSGTITLTVDRSIRIESSCGCDHTYGEPLTPQLMADGLTQVYAEVPGLTDLTWSIEEPALGCQIDPVYNNATPAVVMGARITAGTQAGTISVKAADTNGCYTLAPLDLVCAVDSSCSGEGCGGYGQGQIQNDSGPSLEFGLGGDTAQLAAGKVFLHAGQPLVWRLAPDRLHLMSPGPGTSELRNRFDGSDANTLRQIKAPAGVVDVIVTRTNAAAFNLPEAYELRFYLNSSSPWSLTNGLYDVSDATEAVNWAMELSGLSTNANHRTNVTFTQLTVTETKASATRTFTFGYHSATNAWILGYPSQLGEYHTWESTVSNTNYHHFRVVKSAQAVSEGKRGYETLANGARVLTERVDGAAGERRTDYVYYDSGAPVSHRYRLQQATYPDGSWTIYEYDSSGRVTREYSSFGDQAPTTDVALCRVTEYSYTLTQSPDGVDDDGSWMPLTPRKTVVKVLLNEVARTYRTLAEGHIIEKICPLPGLLWTDAANLVTTTTTYTDAVDYGRTKSIVHPDGTQTLYTYSETNGTFTTTVDRGEPQGAAIQEGTRTITVLGAVGELLSRTTQVLSNSIPTALLVDDFYSYTDDLKRSYTLVSLGNRTN